MALAAYWKQAPEISETAKRFVDVRQGVVGQPLSPPMLPTKVPSQKKYHVDEAVWASKVAWLMESKRANVTGDAISGVRLNQLYQQGRRSYLKHAADLEMKTHGPYANESQKRSLDEQLASGIQLPVVEGMTPQQVSNKIRNDKFLNAPRHQPAFPAAVEDDSVEELPISG